ncbi:integrase [Duganella sp. BJB488]|uniref:DNA-binding protein n=1 Tax=unclassified Duganella TaxID=2636909 RepID=UPI000E3449B6|nr:MULTISPECIES: DNA-binding protein [unclassified Duganella]RFP10963.1 integrase [Duganella sp. BJB489]RFP14487.1 integrase [Duganella sp. BJB488]RFP30424.1 integrase [Duganella sp. BJB480]
MARSGLYKSDVQKARDALISQGTNPSVDAVRVALGNTGSKTTIHKYLKELEAEDVGAGGKRSSISDALQDLVERLAARLQEEAEEGITAIRADADAKAAAHVASLQAAQMESSQLRSCVSELEIALEKQGTALTASQTDHQSESTMRQVAEQQVEDLKQRLAENEAHRQSLEEKHLHARQALEHYRQSVKEQREADIRRHEQQVQQVQAELRLAQQTIAVKQDETTRLNQEGAKLVTELSHAKQDLYEQLTRGRKLEEKIDTLQCLHTHAADTERQLAAKIAEAELLAEQLAAANDQITPIKTQVRELELSLAQANAKLQGQEQIGEQLRAYLDKIAAAPNAAGAGK